jgi:hypothetical protein
VYARTTADPVGNFNSYDRGAFGGWSDADEDCQNTRHELLISRSLKPATLRHDRCLVLTGSWIDLYSGQIEHEASDVDIDHLVPLKFAWDNGAWDWNADKMRRFANDPENLIITKKFLNQSKGSDGPLDWLPPNGAFVCTYINEFLAVLERYSLILVEEELENYKMLRTNFCMIY